MLEVVEHVPFVGDSFIILWFNKYEYEKSEVEETK